MYMCVYRIIYMCISICIEASGIKLSHKWKKCFHSSYPRPYLSVEFTGFVWFGLVQKTWPYRTLQTIEEFKKGKVEFRADKTGIVHLPFGKANFSEEDLLINLMAAVVC